MKFLTIKFPSPFLLSRLLFLRVYSYRTKAIGNTQGMRLIQVQIVGRRYLEMCHCGICGG